jgi:hypothetical protein
MTEKEGNVQYKDCRGGRNVSEEKSSVGGPEERSGVRE